jgi:PadR family transcriptional regulator PadR
MSAVASINPLDRETTRSTIKQAQHTVPKVAGFLYYPALHKLEQERWITAEWGQTENNRSAKFYSLSPLGRKQLESGAANWQRLSAAISHGIQL